MEKVNRRTVKRWGERAGDMNELGAVWNGYSLVEKGKLGEAVEKVGQAVDAEYLATAALVSFLQWYFSVHESELIFSYKHGNEQPRNHYTSILSLPR